VSGARLTFGATPTYLSAPLPALFQVEGLNQAAASGGSGGGGGGGGGSTPAAAFLALCATLKSQSKLLIGQHVQLYNPGPNGYDESNSYSVITPLYAQTGQLPAVLGAIANWNFTNGDPYNTPGGGDPDLNVTLQSITDWCSTTANTYKPQAAAGVVQLSWGVVNPTGGGLGTGISSAQLQSLVTVGSSLYTTFQTQIGQLKTFVQQIVAANPNIVLILRPFIEINSTGSWWYAVQNSQTDVNNQILLHQQWFSTMFTGNTLRNNVLVIYNGNNYGGFGAAAAWPGTAYADLAGWDTYTTTWSPDPAASGNYSSFLGFGVPLFHSEVGAAAYNADPPNDTTNNLIIPNSLRAYEPAVIGYAQFNAGFSITLQQNASTLMNESWAVTLTDLPSFGGGLTLPSAVGALTLTGQTQNSQTFSWTLASAGSNAIASQNIYRTVTTNGVAASQTLLANVSASTTSYTDSAASNSQLNTSFNNGPTVIYSYTVAAVDSAGNLGPQQPQMLAWWYYQGKACFLEGDYSNTTNNYKSTAVSPSGGGTYSIQVTNSGGTSDQSYFQPYSGIPGNGSGSPVTDQTFGQGCPIWAFENGAFNYLTVDIQPTVTGASYKLDVVSRLFSGDIFNNAQVTVGGSSGAFGPATVAGVWGTYKIPLTNPSGFAAGASLQTGLGTLTGSISGTTLSVSANLSGITPQSGGWLSGSGVTANTALSNPSPGGGPAPITLTVSNSQSVSSTTLTVQRTSAYKISFFDDSGTETVYYLDNLGFTRT
jgi:hypothetical protein